MKNKLTISIKLIVLLVCISFSNSLLAQHTISGTVKDKIGVTLPGASIIEKGTNNGTITDIDGNFKLDLTFPNTSIDVTFLGFTTQSIEVNDQTQFDIILEEESSMLSEIVVVGYGSQKRSTIAGAVSSIDLEKARVVPTTNIAEMLRGKAAGVQVTLGDARPGGNSSILIRGKNSLSGSNAPLFVVDGVPVVDGINDINASDVKSIEILKDAASQAIYGARASNGVILITTKRGAAGDIKINYNGYYGTQQLTKNFDLYSPEEWMDLKREAFRTTSNNGMTYFDDDAIFTADELKAFNEKSFIDWEDLVLEKAQIQKHDISISGGDENTRTFASMSLFDQKGILPSSGMQRATLRFNLDQNLSDKVTFGISSYFSRTKQNIESGNVNQFITFAPLAFPFDSLGNVNQFPAGGDTKTNPLWNLNESINEKFTVKNSMNIFVDFKLFKGFKYRISGTSITNNQTGGKYLTTQHSSSPGIGSATVYNRTIREYLVENILDYGIDLDNGHHFDATFVQSINEANYKQFDDKSSEFLTDELGYEGIATGLTQDPSGLSGNGGQGNKRRGITSFLARIRYNYKEKYSITLTNRRDASSVFGDGYKWGNFPAVAVAWNLHEEEFINANFIDNMKFRASYGSIGNEAIPPGQTLPTADFLPYVYDGVTGGGYVPGNTLYNPSLKWETSTTLNLGLDFSIFKQRLSGSVEWYNTSTTDLLVKRAISGGFSSLYDNIGEINNKGLELSLTTNIITNSDIDWYTTVNLSRNRNKIVHLYGTFDESGNELDDIGNGWFIGESINSSNIYIFDGIFQNKFEVEDSAQPDAEAGDIRVIDSNGDGVINADDKQRLNRDPSWYGSFSTNFSYKGFELYADVYVVRGSSKYNGYLASFNSGGSLQGALNGVKVNYWTPENPSNEYPRPNAASPAQFLFDRATVSNSYIRLRTLTVAYNLPENVSSKLSLSKVRLYITGTNLITKTDFLSYSPENNPGQFPEAKAYTFGLNLSF